MIKPGSSISKGAMVVWVVSYIIFILTLVSNFSASHDSIHYLYDIVRGENLFHQHHLLYHFLANKWLLFWKDFFNCRSLSPDGVLLFCRAHYIIESFTALWGASALTVCYLFFRRRFFLSRISSWLGTAIVGFSYGFWFYSINIEVYLPPLFFILLSLYTLTKKEFLASDAKRVAILHSLAILFHQVNVLFVPVVLYCLFRRKMYKSIWTYTILSFIITITVYFVIGWFIEGHTTFASWLSWMQGYTVGHGYWQPLSFKTPIHVLTGFGHAFIGGHFIFQLPAMQSLLQQSFQSHGLKDEIFLSSDISPYWAWILTILAIFLLILMILLIIRVVSFIKKMQSHHHVISPLLVTLFIYSIFFCFWMPEILEFWILQMVIVWLLLIGMLPVIRFPMGINNNIGLAITMVMLFTLNYFGSIRWLQTSAKDWYYVEAQKISKEVSADDIIIVEDEWILKDYLRYYTPATIIATDEPGYDPMLLKKMRDSLPFQQVFIYKDSLTRFY